MKLNIQMFGGRGASSSKTKQSKQSQSVEERFPIPDNITKKQKETLEKIRRIAVRTITGEKYENESEIKRFDVSVSDYGTTSVIVEVGRKNDEGTYGELIGRDTAIIYIGKNGGMKHMSKYGIKLKPTKYLHQAFYDYTYGKKGR